MTYCYALDRSNDIEGELFVIRVIRTFLRLASSLPSSFLIILQKRKPRVRIAASKLKTLLTWLSGESGHSVRWWKTMLRRTNNLL